MVQSLRVDLSRDSLSEQVADQLQEMIIGKHVAPGEKFPGERELAEQLAVSRTVVREAIRILSVRGLVEIKQGSGTYVRELSSEAAVASIGLLLQGRGGLVSFEDLYQVRRMIEIEVAGLASERARDDDIEAMEEAIAKMAESVEVPEQFIRYDLDFHSSLVAAAHNELIPILLEPIVDCLLAFRLLAYRYDRMAAIEGALLHHRNILARVKAHDPAGARRSMLEHLLQAETLMEAVRNGAGDLGSDPNCPESGGLL